MFYIYIKIDEHFNGADAACIFYRNCEARYLYGMTIDATEFTNDIHQF